MGTFQSKEGPVHLPNLPLRFAARKESVSEVTRGAHHRKGRKKDLVGRPRDYPRLRPGPVCPGLTGSHSRTVVCVLCS